MKATQYRQLLLALFRGVFDKYHYDHLMMLNSACRMPNFEHQMEDTYNYCETWEQSSSYIRESMFVI